MLCGFLTPPYYHKLKFDTNVLKHAFRYVDELKVSHRH